MPLPPPPPKLDTTPFPWDNGRGPSTGSLLTAISASTAYSSADGFDRTPSSAGGGPGGSSSSKTFSSRSWFRRPSADAASTLSPSEAYDDGVMPPKKTGRRRRLRSQYPATAAEPHVEFILVAHFNIDSGSVMEHQYPGPISSNEHMLAELMLPEGVHARSQDWTTFFLHKDTGEDDAEEDSSPNGDSTAKDRSAKDSSGGGDDDPAAADSEDEDPLEGPPLVYVLNHVNTKHDASVKRGAIVKAMAICTRHSFLDIYKPILVLAIEEYFKSPTYETLAELYDAVNAMDLSLIPRLSLLESFILSSSTTKDLFVEKFEQMISQQKEEDDSHHHTANSDRALSLARPALPRDTHEFESRIVYKGHSVPVKIPVAKSSESVGSFSVIKLITTFSTPHQSSPQSFSLHAHLTTNGPYTHPIIVLINALLTQKRVMFLGTNRPSEDVAEAVLAACSLVSGGVLRGFTRHAFPYTDLTKIEDLQKVPGFIAGVTNPLFANRDDWWDVLCDLSTGRMKISAKIDIPEMTEGWAVFAAQHPNIVNVSVSSNVSATQDRDWTGDNAFMTAVLRAIKERLGEAVIRGMWRDWIVRLTRIAASFEEIVYGASALYIGGDAADSPHHGLAGHGYVWTDEATRQKELAAAVSRIEGWRNTRSYYNFKQDLIHLYKTLPIKDIDLAHHHDRLRSQKLSRDASAAVYLGFERAVRTPAEVCQLLTVTSESHGGLFYISLGLMHGDADVRRKTVELLERVREHDAGKHFWDRLGKFAQLAFWRIKREMDGRGDETAVLREAVEGMAIEA